MVNAFSLTPSLWKHITRIEIDAYLYNSRRLNQEARSPYFVMKQKKIKFNSPLRTALKRGKKKKKRNTLASYRVHIAPFSSKVEYAHALAWKQQKKKWLALQTTQVETEPLHRSDGTISLQPTPVRLFPSIKKRRRGRSTRSFCIVSTKQIGQLAPADCLFVSLPIKAALHHSDETSLDTPRVPLHFTSIPHRFLHGPWQFASSPALPRISEFGPPWDTCHKEFAPNHPWHMDR